mmetsp:Transcript_18993/g.60295  ORF Transcript_18993/g.60295 Transcript_18993/m.60295 type:complete len:203 (+) Transcript_18993:296-904(+)
MQRATDLRRPCTNGSIPRLNAGAVQRVAADNHVHPGAGLSSTEDNLIRRLQHGLQCLVTELAHQVRVLRAEIDEERVSGQCRHSHLLQQVHHELRGEPPQRVHVGVAHLLRLAAVDMPPDSDRERGRYPVPAQKLEDCSVSQGFLLPQALQLHDQVRQGPVEGNKSVHLQSLPCPSTTQTRGSVLDHHHAEREPEGTQAEKN